MTSYHDDRSVLSEQLAVAYALFIRTYAAVSQDPHFPRGFHPAKEHILASRRDSVTAIVAGTGTGDDRG